MSASLLLIHVCAALIGEGAASQDLHHKGTKGKRDLNSTPPLPNLQMDLAFESIHVTSVQWFSAFLDQGTLGKLQVLGCHSVFLL